MIWGNFEVKNNALNLGWRLPIKKGMCRNFINKQYFAMCVSPQKIFQYNGILDKELSDKWLLITSIVFWQCVLFDTFTHCHGVERIYLCICSSTRSIRISLYLIYICLHFFLNLIAFNKANPSTTSITGVYPWGSQWDVENQRKKLVNLNRGFKNKHFCLLSLTSSVGPLHCEVYNNPK